MALGCVEADGLLERPSRKGTWNKCCHEVDGSDQSKCDFGISRSLRPRPKISSSLRVQRSWCKPSGSSTWCSGRSVVRSRDVFAVLIRSANTLTRSSYPAWTQRLLEEAQQPGPRQLPQLQCFLADVCSNLAVIHSLKMFEDVWRYFDTFEILRCSSKVFWDSSLFFDNTFSKFEVCLQWMYLDGSSSGVATKSSRGEGGSRLLGLRCTCWYKSASLRDRWHFCKAEYLFKVVTLPCFATQFQT